MADLSRLGAELSGCVPGVGVGSGQKYLRFATAAWLVGVAWMEHGAGVGPLNIPDTRAREMGRCRDVMQAGTVVRQAERKRWRV